MEQRLSEMGGGGGGGWGEAARCRDQAGAPQETRLLPVHDEKALQLSQVSGEAEQTQAKGSCDSKSCCGTELRESTEAVNPHSAKSSSCC